MDGGEAVAECEWMDGGEAVAECEWMDEERLRSGLLHPDLMTLMTLMTPMTLMAYFIQT